MGERVESRVPVTVITVLTRLYSSTLGKYHGSSALGSLPLSRTACHSAALTPIIFIPPPISTTSFPLPSCTRSERQRSSTAAGEVLHQCRVALLKMESKEWGVTSGRDGEVGIGNCRGVWMSCGGAKTRFRAAAFSNFAFDS